MARPAVYRLLERPWVYKLSQVVLAPGQWQIDASFFGKVLTEPAALALDVGCGPRLLRPTGAGRVVGVDLNPDYVRSYTGGWVDTDVSVLHAAGTGRSRFGFVCSADQLPFTDGTFDEARCERLLHHLAPSQATAAIREMMRCVRPGGRVILMDPVLPVRAWRRPLAWLLMKLDRGEWVRTEQEMLQLVRAASAGEWSVQRYTCNYLGAEALTLILHKEGRACAAAGTDRPVCNGVEA